ncbi:MAG: hypothetical protein ACI86X_000646 [Moritella sp.]|jgi:hypothetical protein
MCKKFVLLALLALTLPIQAAESVADKEKANNPDKLKITPLLSQQRLFDQDLIKYQPESEIAWLGDKETRFLTLWSEQTSAKVIGTSWIFSDTYTSANNPNVIQTLRYQLNEKGLHTYSISPLSQRIETEQAEQRLLSQLTILQDKIVSEKGKRLLITQGSNSVALVNVLTKNPAVHIDAIILLGAYSASQKGMVQLTEQITQLPMPVLDLYHQLDSQIIVAGAHMRNTAARRKHKLNYRQAAVIGMPAQTATQISTSQTVYGWLVTLGWY